jgi:hypothetical protein
MPRLDVLPRRKSVYSSLGPIPHDESTNMGNLNILENIFQGQYNLPVEQFKNALYLIYGDQKTIQRIRTIKTRRRAAARAVDRLEWALPVPALFHLRMNYLFMLSRTHFGAACDGSQSTLYHAMNLWSRKGISRAKSNFYALQQLVIHSFQSRICAIAMELVSHRRSDRRNLDFPSMLRLYSPDQLNGLINEIFESYTLSARYTENKERRNHILYLQHAQNYLLLKYAIKHADLGLILRAVQRSCVYFHASGQHKYAYEMLYFLRLTTTKAASPELQRAVLANGLVNTSGADDSWFETDRLVEFHNGQLKTIFNDRRGSAITVQYLMENCALNTEVYRSLDLGMESFLDLSHNRTHPDDGEKMQNDIKIMAEKLFNDGSISGTLQKPVMHEAVDLFDAAMSKLGGDALVKFNRKECRGITDVDDSFDLDNEAPSNEVLDFFAVPALD